MTLARDTQGTAIKISSCAELTKFESEIRRFDIIMDLIQMHVPEDLKVWNRIAEVRDAVFRLQQQMRGCEIAIFCKPWIEPEDVGFPYESPADIFWDRKKQRDYDEEIDQGLEDEEEDEGGL